MVTLKFKKVKTLPDSEFLFSVLKRNLCRFLFLEFFSQILSGSHRNICTTKMVDLSSESLFLIRRDEIIIRS